MLSLDCSGASLFHIIDWICCMLGRLKAGTLHGLVHRTCVNHSSVKIPRNTRSEETISSFPHPTKIDQFRHHLQRLVGICPSLGRGSVTVAGLPLPRLAMHSRELRSSACAVCLFVFFVVRHCRPFENQLARTETSCRVF